MAVLKRVPELPSTSSIPGNTLLPLTVVDGGSPTGYMSYYATFADFKAAIDAVGIIAAGVWNGSAIDDSYISSAVAWNAKINDTEKAAANGVATLDGTGRIPSSQLPLTALEYKGTWNATTNTPTLADGVGTNGDVYIVDVAGTQDLGSGNIEFNVSDWAVYNGTIWEKSSHTEAFWGSIGGTLANQTDLQSALDDKQDDLTFGIANTNSLVVDGVPVLNDYAKFTASGLVGRSYAEVKTDLSLNNVENTALTGWVGTSSITTVGTLASGNATAIVSAASTTLAGKVELATQTETGTGTDTVRAVTPAGLTNGFGGSANIDTLGTISTGVWSATDIAIAAGGTGQSTAQAAINALTAVAGATVGHVLTKVGSDAVWAAGGGGATSPLTTKGDLWVYTTVDARLGVGTNDFVLTADSTAPSGVAWKAATGGGIAAVVDDTSPQLGGELDVNGNDIDMGLNTLKWGGGLGWSITDSAGVLTFNDGSSDLVKFSSSEPALQADTIGSIAAMGLVFKDYIEMYDGSSTYDIRFGSAGRIIDNAGYLAFQNGSPQTYFQLGMSDVEFQVPIEMYDGVGTHPIKFGAAGRIAESGGYLVLQNGSPTTYLTLGSTDLELGVNLNLNNQQIDTGANTGTDGQVLTKVTGSPVWADASGGMSDLVDDTSPQLGGNLDTNGKQITNSAGNLNIDFAADIDLYDSVGYSYKKIKWTPSGGMSIGSDGSSIIFNDGTNDFALFSTSAGVNFRTDVDMYDSVGYSYKKLKWASGWNIADDGTGYLVFNDGSSDRVKFSSSDPAIQVEAIGSISGYGMNFYDHIDMSSGGSHYEVRWNGNYNIVYNSTNFTLDFRSGSPSTLFYLDDANSVVGLGDGVGRKMDLEMNAGRVKNSAGSASVEFGSNVDMYDSTDYTYRSLQWSSGGTIYYNDTAFELRITDGSSDVIGFGGGGVNLHANLDLNTYSIIGLQIGTDVQAYSSVLQGLADSSLWGGTDDIPCGDGAGGVTFKTIGTDIQAYSTSLNNIGAYVDGNSPNDTSVIGFSSGNVTYREIGTDIQAFGAVLDDLNTLGASTADGEFLVATGAGALAWESGATARTSIGLGTTDSPTFAGITITDLIEALDDTGTDKIGFFGATPVAQPSGTGETTGFTAGTGTAVNDDSTFTGNLGTTAYRINDVVKALKQLGLLAL